MEKNLIYLDHSATTPVDPEVGETVKSAITEAWGNPSSIHSPGRRARVLVEDAREKVAALLGSSPEEIYFTSGGTEADNWALRGIAHTLKGKGDHIITAETEHPAVLEACKALENEGFNVSYLYTDRYGTVHPHDLAAEIRKETILISLMQANNEFGTLNPVRDYAKVAREAGVLFHCDMVQSFGKVLTDVSLLGIDLASVSSHKIYGPKGAGALYVRSGVEISPITFGGHQERNRRLGTENVPGIAGFGRACELRGERIDEDTAHLKKLVETFMEQIGKEVENVSLNGHPERRIPGHLSLTFDGVDGEALLMNLDTMGIAASAGAACASGAINASHVLTAVGMKPEEARGTLRFTFGRGNTAEDAERAAEAVTEQVVRLRKLAAEEETVTT